jgi:hypothetical protein
MANGNWETVEGATHKVVSPAINDAVLMAPREFMI